MPQAIFRMMTTAQESCIEEIYTTKYDVYFIRLETGEGRILCCSTMRGRIKGTDSTINAILATAVLYELRWKIWNGVE